MKAAYYLVSVITVSSFAGCANIDFGGGGVTYYDPKPYLFVSTTKDCVTTATVVSLPDTKKAMKFESGFGSADLSATFNNGMLASIGQKTDTKIPETITSVAALGTAALGGFMAAKADTEVQVICVPTATLYPIQDGVPDSAHPTSFPVKKEIIGKATPGK